MTVAQSPGDKGPLLAELQKRREELKVRLAEAEAALPAHTIRPHQMQRVLELEEELAEVERLLARSRAQT